MNYIPPFVAIKEHVRIVTVHGERRVELSYDELQQMIRVMLAGLQVDEAWYLARYEDVAAGIRDGTIASAKEHFIDHGYFEGRQPFAMAVDERWYLSTYADVAEHVRQGAFPNGQHHFDASGYREGRLPRAL